MHRMNIRNFSKAFGMHRCHLLDVIKTGCSFASFMSMNKYSVKKSTIKLSV